MGFYIELAAVPMTVVFLVLCIVVARRLINHSNGAP